MSYDYEFVDGDITWIKGTTEDLTFTIDALDEKFKELRINGKAVDKNVYTHVSGSTIITVEADYLNGLELGSYTLTAVYTDGTAEAMLNVAAAEEAGDESSDTGDDSNAVLWLMLMMISITAAAITVASRRYNRG